MLYAITIFLSSFLLFLVQPLIARLNSLLGSAENTAEEIRRRVLIEGTRI